MKRFSKKLNSKWEESFKILKKKNYLNYEIDLFHIIGNYRIFHIFFLIKDLNDLLLEQEYSLFKLIKIVEEKEFEVKEILNI